MTRHGSRQHVTAEPPPPLAAENTVPDSVPPVAAEAKAEGPNRWFNLVIWVWAAAFLVMFLQVVLDLIFGAIFGAVSR